MGGIFFCTLVIGVVLGEWDRTMLPPVVVPVSPAGLLVAPVERPVLVLLGKLA